MNPLFDPPKVLNSEVVLDELIQVKKDLLLYETTAHHYFVVSTKKTSVAIVATSKKNEVLITHEYRHAVEEVVLGCPGGLIDGEESPIEAAKRELLEETGYEATSYTVLGFCYPLPGLLNQKMYIVHAEEIEKVQEPHLEPTELISVALFEKEHLIPYMAKHPTDGVLRIALSFLIF